MVSAIGAGAGFIVSWVEPKTSGGDGTWPLKALRVHFKLERKKIDLR